MIEKALKVKAGFRVPADIVKTGVKDIKVRQRSRKETGKPQKVTGDILYQMLYDILENQANAENMLKKLQN